MLYLVSLLIVSQIISFYLIFKKISPIIIREKVKGIILKPIPSGINLEKVDGTNELVRDVMKSVILEGWDVVVYGRYDSYTINIKSNSGIAIDSSIRIYNDKSRSPYLSSFSITTVERGVIDYHRLSIEGDSVMAPEIIKFLWDFIIKYHEDNNTKDKNRFNRSIDVIGSRLTAVRRDNKLNDLGI